MGEAVLKRVTFTLLIMVLAAVGDRHWFRIEAARAAVVSARAEEHQSPTVPVVCANISERKAKKRIILFGPELRAQFESSLELAKRAQATDDVTS